MFSESRCLSVYREPQRVPGGQSTEEISSPRETRGCLGDSPGPAARVLRTPCSCSGGSQAPGSPWKREVPLGTDSPGAPRAWAWTWRNHQLYKGCQRDLSCSNFKPHLSNWSWASLNLEESEGKKPDIFRFLQFVMIHGVRRWAGSQSDSHENPGSVAFPGPFLHTNCPKFRFTAART